MSDTRQTYDTGSRLLHWGHALLIVGLIGWGAWMADLPKGAERGWAIGIHKSFGLIAIFTVIFRLLWRLKHPAPPHQLPPIEAKLAIWGHRALYGLLAAVPLAGYTSACFTKYPMKFFGIELPKPGWPDEALNSFFSNLHAALAWALAAMIIAHVIAVIIHARQGRSVLYRMLPSRKP